jgi:hypothetical protein
MSTIEKANAASPMNITALIRENATGEVREYKDTLDVTDDGVPNSYIWEDGNWACDCNRSMFFDDVGDVREDDGHQRPTSPCGSTAFSVNLRRDDTGEIFYREYTL